VYAFPHAKLHAEENGEEITTVIGTGFDGFIIERDANDWYYR